MTDHLPPSRLQDYLRVVRRRKWTFLQAVVLVPTLAVLYALQQEPRYRASAEVLLSRQNLAASLNGIQDPTQYQLPDRLAQTDADAASVPTVVQRALDATHAGGRTVAQFLAESSVTPKPNADFLVFSVTDRSRYLAARLATEYARQFTIYRRELDTGALDLARKEVQSRLAKLVASDQGKSAIYAALVTKEEQLATMAALQTSNTFLVRPASTASQVAPRPVRDGLLGLGLGLVLGLMLVFLWEALDTRVRAGEAIASRLGLPLLARIPGSPRRLREKGKLAMIDEPTSMPSEAYRTLRANLEFAGEERGVHTIMVTSAVDREGKSTTAANLAVALARVGRCVVLVDLDLRRPGLQRFFALEGRPGVTQVARGRAKLEEALLAVPITPAYQNGNGNRSGAVRLPEHRLPPGSLYVLGAGALPSDPGEFVASGGLREVLAQLAQTADFVLIDAPPLLSVGDALAASSSVDALLVVSRLEKARRPVLDELKRVLDRCEAPALGFVVTGTKAEGVYGYGYGYR
jgi:polysaccharide biosynthesis transport protein